VPSGPFQPHHGLRQIKLQSRTGRTRAPPRNGASPHELASQCLRSGGPGIALEARGKVREQGPGDARLPAAPRGELRYLEGSGRGPPAKARKSCSSRRATPSSGCPSGLNVSSLSTHSSVTRVG